MRSCVRACASAGFGLPASECVQQRGFFGARIAITQSRVRIHVIHKMLNFYYYYFVRVRVRVRVRVYKEAHTSTPIWVYYAR